MNYLEQIVAFYRWKEVNPLPASAIALWHELMAICNKAGWPEDFTVPNAVLQSNAGMSRREFERARQMLVDLGLINYKKSPRVNNAGKYSINYFPIVQNVQRNVQRDVQQEVQRAVHGTYNETYNETCTLYKPKLKLNKTEKEYIPFAEIVAYLNEKTGSSFKATSKATQSHIRARWREGYRLEDFKAVIDAKTQEWSQPVNGKDMSVYLRPETLFGSKFESYLNQAKRGLTLVPTGSSSGKRPNPKDETPDDFQYIPLPEMEW